VGVVVLQNKARERGRAGHGPVVTPDTGVSMLLDWATGIDMALVWLQRCSGRVRIWRASATGRASNCAVARSEGYSWGWQNDIEQVCGDGLVPAWGVGRLTWLYGADMAPGGNCAGVLAAAAAAAAAVAAAEGSGACSVDKDGVCLCASGLV
jgi:hypothetical protein